MQQGETKPPIMLAKESMQPDILHASGAMKKHRQHRQDLIQPARETTQTKPGAFETKNDQPDVWGGNKGASTHDGA